MKKDNFVLKLQNINNFDYKFKHNDNGTVGLKEEMKISQFPFDY